HRVTARLPAVKVAHYADGGSVGRPDTELHAHLPGALLLVGAKTPVRLAVIALLEQVHRQIRRVVPNLFLSRFHMQLLPARATLARTFYSLILNNFKQFCKAFMEKLLQCFSFKKNKPWIFTNIYRFSIHSRHTPPKRQKKPPPLFCAEQRRGLAWFCKRAESGAGAQHTT